MTQYKLDTNILKAVETQIIKNEPTCARVAFNRLMELGYTQIQTLELIGSVLVTYMNDKMPVGNEFDEAEYALKLDQLYKDAATLKVEPVQLDEILKEKHAGYDALMNDDKEEMIKHFLAGFELVKQLVKKEFLDTKPELVEIDAKNEFKYGLMSWFEDIERELGAANKYQERIDYCKQLMELFTWKDASIDTFNASIGESYCAMGKEAECKEWFEQLLAEKPGNACIIESYLSSLIEMGQADLAMEVAKKEINMEMECDLDTEAMFVRAQSLFQQAGDVETSNRFKEKITAFHDKCLEYAKAYEKKKLMSKAGQQAKVYPNDLCPCGSGKKYKKCCGK
ncbi:MAG: SEC-C metal-binding domain-containing protein [bacterium]|nr:SEC-C metal-binding domain-containing protein [bacterium]